MQSTDISIGGKLKKIRSSNISYLSGRIFIKISWETDIMAFTALADTKNQND